MARDFNGTTDRLEVDTAAATALPLTMACWFRPDTVTVDYCMMYVGDKDSAQCWRLEARGTAAGDPVSAATTNGAGTSRANTSTGFSASTWQHACAVFAGDADRRAYLNGGGKGTGATSRALTATPDRTSIGRQGQLTPAQYFDGRLAEAAFWNVALTDNEVQMLAEGTSPLRVRPASRIAYIPVLGRSPEPDYAGALLNLTVTGTTIVDHAPVAPMFSFPFEWFGAFTAGGAPPSTVLQDIIGGMGIIPFPR